MEKIIRWNLKESDFQKIKEIITTKYMKTTDYVGSLEIGQLLIELLLKNYDGDIYLDFDVYVGGIDTGYGETMNNLPYDYADGGELLNLKDICKINSFNEFKEYILREIEDFIKNSPYKEKGFSLKDKASSNEFFQWDR